MNIIDLLNPIFRLGAQREYLLIYDIRGIILTISLRDYNPHKRSITSNVSSIQSGFQAQLSSNQSSPSSNWNV